MMRALGMNQRGVLRALKSHHGWYDGCGWVWTTPRATIRMLEPLVKRGLVVRVLRPGAVRRCNTPSRYIFKLTLAGQVAVDGLPKTIRKNPQERTET